MADCHKCGARLAHKRADGRRKCKHCGFSAGNSKLSRSGTSAPFVMTADQARHVVAIVAAGELRETEDA